MDFDIKTYSRFLDATLRNGYSFQTFKDYLKEPNKKVIILRHDVDLKPYNSLQFAKIQAERNIKGTYYFRAVKESWDEAIIIEIESLGHEVGYHYECLTTAKGNNKIAMEDFQINLEKLRELVTVSTICMHGSPLSKYDSKDLWNQSNYRDFNIIGEPYFDLNFNQVLYLTDTGRTWNNKKVSVRDHATSIYKFKFNNTNEIIKALDKKELPDQIMFTFHPQRWTDNPIHWTIELIMQNIKNQIKKLIVKH
jgi:hypothetical protein